MAGLLLTVATTASASWTVKDVPGTPNDVEVWDDTRFSVSTSTGAYLYSTDGGTLASLSTGPSTGTYLTGNGCFASFVSNDSVVSPANCAGADNVLGDNRLAGPKVKATETGAFYALVQEPDLGAARVAFGPPGSFEARPWRSYQLFSGTAMALGVAHHGAAEHALAAVSFLRDVNLHWLIDGSPAGTPITPLNDGSFPPKEVQTIDLFPTGRADPTALLGWNNGLYRGELSRGPGANVSFGEVPLPGGPGLVTALDVNTGVGAQHGDGFGMATVRRSGGVALLRTVPTTRPQDIGTQWVASTPVPALSSLLSPRYLECQGAKLCVVAQTTANTGNVFVYINDAPPQLMVGTGQAEPFILPERTSRTVNVSAPDSDGDPVRLEVSPSSVSLPGLTMTPTVVGGGVDLAITAGAVCATISQPLTITATDGLDGHAVVRNYLLQVQHTLQPNAPVITPQEQPGPIPAGSGRRTFKASQTNAGCVIREYRWTPLSPGAPPLELSGADKSTAVFDSPQILCNPLGETHRYLVEAVDEGGLVSQPTDLTLQVLPWGAPSPPLAPNTQVTVVAGDTASGPVWLRPAAPVHPCEGSNGFPGVETVWELADGQPPPPGVRLVTQDGTRITGSRVVTPELGIEADECIDAEFSIDVQHFTAGAPGPASAVSRVLVKVQSHLNPVSEGTVTLTPTLTTAESVAGIAGVTGIQCLDQRTERLQARLTLKQGGMVIREATVPVPGPWQFTLGEACFGATYQLEGELLAGKNSGSGVLPGGPQSVVVREDISVPPVERVTLEPMEAPHLTAQCGQPATGTLEQRPLAPCAELPVSWEQVGGPALTEASFTGQRIDVATQEADFGALIGQQVVMRMRARTMQETSLDQEIPITVEPFVELQRRTERGTGTDTGLVGVSVELRNTTACGVSEVEHWERLEGMDYQPGSARFNGTPVEAELDGDVLKMKGLVLEGGSLGQLTYVVRPRLLESARFEGQSFLRKVSLSRPLEEPPVEGCGCSGGGSGLAAFGLASLAAALRSRRGR
ncbi:hypothetical protein DB31_6317 [Hyalangium minutum]|uniref:Uncharacterized protein n=2 Tax=Hyalangium minutum TaxID=394096 RepID=A0A085WNS9_9BACT|nr:hypothetical protein DB31_6317 [Hyalangium minutum]